MDNMLILYSNDHMIKSTKRVFGSVVAVAFQIIFHAEMHANDVFDISTSK
jgi:hypothetical protein